MPPLHSEPIVNARYSWVTPSMSSQSNFYPYFPPHLCPRLCILSAYGCSNSFATPAAQGRNPRVEKAVGRRPPDGKQHWLCYYVKTENQQKHRELYIEHFHLHLLGLDHDVVAVHHSVGLHHLLLASGTQTSLTHWEDHILTADQVMINFYFDGSRLWKFKCWSWIQNLTLR